MKIGVFDSGIGGAAVAKRLQELFPDDEIMLVDDHQHVPYGTRPAEEIISLTDTAIQPLLTADVDVIVIACNTATAVAINTLRERYPDRRFVGIEPMIKPAALESKNHHIAVFATPATLQSSRYHHLKEQWAEGITIDEPDCFDWASLIEDNRPDDVPIEQTVEAAIDQGADVIVLACTHYHWLKSRAQQAAGHRAIVLEPTDAISDRIKDILGNKI